MCEIARDSRRRVTDLSSAAASRFAMPGRGRAVGRV